MSLFTRAVVAVFDFLIKIVVERTTEHVDETHPNMLEETENVLKGEKNLNLTNQHAEKMSAKVTDERTKVEQIDKESIKVTKERGKEEERTTEHGHETHPNKFEETENVFKEEKKQNLTNQPAKEMSAKLSIEGTKAQQLEKESLKETKERGKVPILEYQTLREYRVEMVNTLVPEDLIPHLKKNKVIDDDDMEKIEKKCKDLRRKGAETMLDIVYNSGRWAFKKLIEVLQITKYQELAQKLTTDLKKKRTGPSPTNTKEQRGRLSGIESEVLKDNHERLVDELDSSVLKNHLFQNNLIDEDDLERITKNEEELRKEGTEEMITIIYNSGQNVLPKLLKSLDEAGYRELSSKLRFDYAQKKGMLAFPDYPVEPELVVDKGSNPLSDWKQKLTKWRKENAGKSWCDTMNKWFLNHEYTNKDELKMVVEHWLCKVGEVVDKGCLEIDEINLILNVTEKCQGHDSNTSLLQYINEMFGSKITQENLEPESENLKAQKKRLHEQYQRVFENLKQSLEGIIAGEQNCEILPLALKSCELVDHFDSVFNDVREKWNKLH